MPLPSAPIDGRGNLTDKMHIVKFRGEECTVHYQKYFDGNTCIRLISECGEPMCTATINMPQINVAPDYVVIKNYGENGGILDALEEALIVKRIEEYIINDFNVTVWLCKLLKAMYSFN